MHSPARDACSPAGSAPTPIPLKHSCCSSSPRWKEWSRARADVQPTRLMAPDMSHWDRGLPGGGGGKRTSGKKGKEEGCVEEVGEERSTWMGHPMHLEHRRRNSWRKSGYREFGILEGSTPLSQIWPPPHLLHTLQSCRKNPDFGEVDFGSLCCAILASSFPSLASQFAHLYTGLGTGRGAEGMRREALLCNFPAE